MKIEELLWQLEAYKDDFNTVKDTMDMFLIERGYEILSSDEAERLAVHETEISKLEEGYQLIPADDAERLAEYDEWDGSSDCPVCGKES